MPTSKPRDSNKKPLTQRFPEIIREPDRGEGLDAFKTKLARIARYEPTDELRAGEK